MGPRDVHSQAFQACPPEEYDIEPTTQLNKAPWLGLGALAADGTSAASGSHSVRTPQEVNLGQR